jgi:quercetin dioxygenase-like cupin family protein
VSFEPGARTAWHCHLRGQLIVCTAGRGLVVTRDGSELPLEPGTAVWTEPGEDHWHGAAADSGMTHLAVQTADAGSGDGAQWHEPVAGAAKDGTCHG